MKQFFLGFALLAAIPVYAAPPAPPRQIVGAEHPIPLGDLGILFLSPIPPEISNLVSSSVDWTLFDSQGAEKRVLKSPDGSLTFGTGVVPQKLKAVAAVTYLFGAKDGDSLKNAETVTSLVVADVIVGDAPAPAPPPAPAPDPDPTFDPGKYGLAAFAYQATKSIESPTKGDEAKALAASMKGIAAGIAAGSIGRDAQSQTTASNQAALARFAGAKARWQAWSSALNGKLTGLFDGGQLQSLADYAQALNEISAGLEAVR